MGSPCALLKLGWAIFKNGDGAPSPGYRSQGLTILVGDKFLPISSQTLLTPLMSVVSCLPRTAVNYMSVCEALGLRVRCGMEERGQEQHRRFKALCKVSIMANPPHGTLCLHSESVGVLGSLPFWQRREVAHRGTALTKPVSEGKHKLILQATH